MNAPIACEGMGKRFGRTVALEGLQWEVPEGSIYALIGPNGAGKTTLIKMLVNILRPTSGKAMVLGKESRRLSAADFAEIGYVSENQKLPDWMTIDYLFSYLKPFYPTWDDARAAELRREFALPGDRRIGQLSRGMKMKAALASSLAYHPKLLLLDEPLSGLDPLVRDEFIQGLLEHAGEMTVLVSSHDLADLETFASHVGFLDAGRMQFSEEAATLSERFREIEVTMAESAALPAALPATTPARWPAGWLKPQAAGAVIRFVDSGFHEERTKHAVGELFPGAVSVVYRAMPLRSIFIALAKAGRA